MDGWIKMPLGTEVGLGPGDIVLDGDPTSPLIKGAQQPPLSANVHCCETAEWIKMPLGMEVALGPGDFVFDGNPAAPRKKGTPPLPNFWPMSIVATVAHLSYC